MARSRSSAGKTEGAAPAVPSVKHPALGTITDPRKAYLTGFTEGMQHGFITACRQLADAATERERPDDPCWALADTIARVVAIREAIAAGNASYAEALAEGLELDLQARMQRLNKVAT